MAVPPVWSTRICALTTSSTGSYVTVYTVPADKVLILRRVTLVEFSGAAGGIVIALNGSTHLLSRLNAVYQDAFDIDTWLVFEPGDHVSVFAVTGPWHVSMHGQLLTVGA